MNIKAIMVSPCGGFYLCNKENVAVNTTAYETCGDSYSFMGYIDIDNVDEFVDLYAKGYTISDIKDLMDNYCDKDFQGKVFAKLFTYLTLELSAVESELANL